jgi:hypothetical protein
MHQNFLNTMTLSLCLLLACTSLSAQSTDTPSQRFGMNTHIRHWEHVLDMDFIQTLKDGGLIAFRDGQEWDTIEKAKGVYTFSDSNEKMIDHANALGMEPLFVLAYESPKGLYENELDPEAFANYAAHAVTYYKGRVKYFQIWNEPQNFFFKKQYGGTWNGKEKDNSDSPWVSKFAEFVTIVAKRMKEANPDICIITGSAAPANHRLLARYPKMWEHVDVLTLHPYPYSLPPEVVPWGGKNNERDGVYEADDTNSFKSYLQTYRKTLDDMGRKDMKIWITEVGYNTAQITKKQLWLGFKPYAQACYNVRMGIQAAGLGVDRLFYYDMIDDGTNKHYQENNFGQFYRDGKPKPAWTAISRMAKLMPGDTQPTPMNIDITVPSFRDYHVGVQWDEARIKFINTPQQYSFVRPDGKRVIFIWKAGRIFADAQDDVANVTINDCPFEIIEAGHVVSGEKLDLDIKRDNSTRTRCI